MLFLSAYPCLHPTIVMQLASVAYLAIGEEDVEDKLGV